MMFIGMGLLKFGVLSGERSTRFYALCLFVGYGIGIPMNAITAYFIVKSRFNPATQAFAGSAYDLERLTMALGHLGLIMLVVKLGVLRPLTGALAAVGRMALSNYIFQSLATVVIFTGTGFAFYGSLQRYQLYYAVIAIWAFQLIMSPIGLRRFRFGPLEWCWRSLTYWRKQPMRRYPRSRLSSISSLPPA
jgi:uncharacterized protein